MKESCLVITGGSGFVGKNLTEKLKSSEIPHRQLLRKELFSNTNFFANEVIVHLAGKAHDLKGNSDSKEYFDVNFKITKRLYDAFLESDAKKFIFISSVKAAADSLDQVLTEDIQAKPLTEYGKSKLMAEEYIQSQNLPKGKSYYILRPCMIHGPGNKGNLNLLYKVVRSRIPYPLGSFDNQRSFLSISNLILVILSLAKNNIASGIYNVADDVPLSTNQVIKIIGETSGFGVKFLNANSKIILTLARFGDCFGLPLNSERLQKLTESYVVSNEKIKKALNISKLPTSSRQGLIETIRSFKTK